MPSVSIYIVAIAWSNFSFIRFSQLIPSLSTFVAVMARSTLYTLVAVASLTYVAGQAVVGNVPTFCSPPLADMRYPYAQLVCVPPLWFHVFGPIPN
jgi:hypothetical protein